MYISFCFSLLLPFLRIAHHTLIQLCVNNIFEADQVSSQATSGEAIWIVCAVQSLRNDSIKFHFHILCGMPPCTSERFQFYCSFRKWVIEVSGARAHIKYFQSNLSRVNNERKIENWKIVGIFLLTSKRIAQWKEIHKSPAYSSTIYIGRDVWCSS